MHKMHHSRWRPETDSNYSTFFSIWDRLARSFRMRSDPKTLNFGLDEYDEPQWQTFWGMLKTPFVSAVRRTPGDSPTEQRDPRGQAQPRAELKLLSESGKSR